MTITSEPVVASRRISNSEASTWLICQAQYRYGYDLKLEKIPTGKSAKGVGIATHEGFQAYNRARVAGADHHEGIVACNNALGGLLNGGESHMQDVFQARIMTGIYFEKYGDEFPYFEVIDAERTVDLPMGDGYSMPLRYDLYYIDKRTRKYVLSDYKTTYDFWDSDRIALSPQFAKYFAAFVNNDMPVDECRLDQIRTRWAKVEGRSADDLFKRVPVKPSKDKIRNVLRQHILASQRIVEFRELPDNVRPVVALPSLNWTVCKMCDFRSLCRAELDGSDTTLVIQTEYKKNTYDYNPTEPSIKELM